MYYILFYDYVDDVLERRVPWREEHLGLARNPATCAQWEIQLPGLWLGCEVAGSACGLGAGVGGDTRRGITGKRMNRQTGPVRQATTLSR